MDASTKKRVLVVSLAFVMVASAVAILFQIPQNSGSASGDQSPVYLVGQAPSGNGVDGQASTQSMIGLNSVLQTYPVTFTSIGLPDGTSWSVTVDGTNLLSTVYSTITFQLSNGTHSFEVSNPTSYMATPSSGVVLVYGSSVSQYLSFSLVQYELKFMETGLSTGSTWSVNVAGQSLSSASNSIAFQLPNGSYNYSITGPVNFAAQPSSGKAVVYGQDLTVNVPFSTTLHEVTFNFNGSTTGTSWALHFDGQAFSVSGSSLTILMPNGLYDYSISTSGEYLATPSSGSILVLDSDASLNVTIHQKTYTVTFEHQGMSVGKTWGITLGGISHNSTSSVITFEVPAGSYNYTVTGASGYTAASNGGTLNVTSQDQNVNVTFTKNPDYLTGTMLSLAGAAIGIAAGIGIGIYIIRKR